MHASLGDFNVHLPPFFSTISSRTAGHLRPFFFFLFSSPSRHRPAGRSDAQPLRRATQSATVRVSRSSSGSRFVVIFGRFSSSFTSPPASSTAVQRSVSRSWAGDVGLG